MPRRLLVVNDGPWLTDPLAGQTFAARATSQAALCLGHRLLSRIALLYLGKAAQPLIHGDHRRWDARLGGQLGLTHLPAGHLYLGL